MNKNRLKELLDKEINDQKDTILGDFVRLLIRKSVSQKTIGRGMALAATFDLLVGVFYYQKVPRKSWLLCPNGEEHYFFPYVNVCPRCALQKDFVFHKAGKGQSGNIGAATIKALVLFVQEWFALTENKLVVFKGEEPIDLCVYDAGTETVFLAEVKSAPLLTLPLTIQADSKGMETETEHEDSVIAALLGTRMGVMLPVFDGGGWTGEMHYFNRRYDGNDAYFVEMMTELINNNVFFGKYLLTWTKAFDAYTRKDRSEAIFWLTNGCGTPSPVPNSWPSTSSGGRESISDSKTSVGLDRTDDIKKGVYQLLKLRMTPINADFNVKVGIFSNTHAARHHEEYIEPISDILWLKSDQENVTVSGDLPRGTPVHNLYDGIITFTKNFTQDSWLKQNFDFND